MKSKKKAQALSLNAIIIAALVLLVLVVIAIIFGTRSKDFYGGTENCASKGGTCLKTDAESCISAGLPQIFGKGKANDCEDGFCCLDILGKIGENGQLKNSETTP
jgi:hypothetical protein